MLSTFHSFCELKIYVIPEREKLQEIEGERVNRKRKGISEKGQINMGENEIEDKWEEQKV